MTDKTGERWTHGAYRSLRFLTEDDQMVRVLVTEAIGNLLAVIHRDGGHYEGNHGTPPAIEEAQRIVVGLRSELAAKEETIRGLVEAIGNFHNKNHGSVGGPFSRPNPITLAECNDPRCAALSSAQKVAEK